MNYSTEYSLTCYLLHNTALNFLSRIALHYTLFSFVHIPISPFSIQCEMEWSTLFVSNAILSEIHTVT